MIGPSRWFYFIRKLKLLIYSTQMFAMCFLPLDVNGGFCDAFFCPGELVASIYNNLISRWNCLCFWKFTHFMNNHLAGSRRFLAFHYSMAALFIIFWRFSKVLKARLLTELGARKSINHNTICINCSPKMLYHPQFFGHKSSPRKIPSKKIGNKSPNNEETLVHVIQFVTFFDHRVGGPLKKPPNVAEFQGSVQAIPSRALLQRASLAHEFHGGFRVGRWRRPTS